MRRIREILRLCWELKLSQPKVAQALNMSSSTVNRQLAAARAAGLSWPLPDDLDDASLERLLFPPVAGRPQTRVEPDWNYIHAELKRKGVTLTLLWQEYKEQNGEGGYQISQFCDNYRKWRSQLNLTMRQHHRAGDKAFSDFAGAKFQIVDPATGEVRDAHLFVSALGASSYTFAEALPDETSKSWCLGQVKAFEYFGGAPEVIVPDNPKSTVIKPCRYEPELNRSFQEMAKHYGCAVLPARVRHPKDKAKVECAVGVATRWIYARLRNQTFFSLGELNAAIKPLLEDLNSRPFKKLPGSRRTAFEECDKPALRPLPVNRYEYSQHHKVRVQMDYHVEFDKHWYSVPYQLVRKEVELRATATTIEILHGGKRVASHPRSNKPGATTTSTAHMPPAHRQYAEWTPEKMVKWANQIGPATKRLIEQSLEGKEHPELAYKRCFGILKLAKLHGADRLEAACQRGLATGAVSYRSIKSILEIGLDKRPLPRAEYPTQLKIVHGNIRGAGYFSDKEETQC